MTNSDTENSVPTLTQIFPKPSVIRGEVFAYYQVFTLLKNAPHHINLLLDQHGRNIYERFLNVV